MNSILIPSLATTTVFALSLNSTVSNIEYMNLQQTEEDKIELSVNSFPSDIIEKELFETNGSYKIIDDEQLKIHALSSFSKDLLNNSIELEGDFVRFVDDNFWDLF